MKRRDVAQEGDDSHVGAESVVPQRLPSTLTRWTGFLLSWVADSAGQEYAQAIKTLGILPQHLAILTLLEADGPLVQARIGERLSLVKHAIVALLNELEVWGLAERQAHPHDKRAFLVAITEQGRDRLRQAEPVSQRVTEQFFADLTMEEQQIFHSLLLRLAESNMARLYGEPKGPDDASRNSARDE